MQKLTSFLLSALLGLALFATEAPAQRSVLKLATLVPDGSVWDKTFEQMGSEWKEETKGRVNLRVYPGGVAGDEPDIIRKMRIGQLQAASLTVTGLATIDPYFSIFETPMFFDSAEELDYVLERVTPELKERLEAKGFVFVHWGHAGWVHLFSKKPVTTLDDLRKQKQWVWAGDNKMIEWWKENGFQPVALSVPDIPTGLQTGMIEAVPTPPLAAVSLQWFRSTPYMLDYGVVPYLGATVVTKAAWDKIDAADRTKLLDAGQRAEAHLRTEVPKQEAAAIKEMQSRGLELTQPDQRGADSDWGRAAARFTEQITKDGESKDFFERVVKLRDEFRASDGSAGESK